MNGTHLRQPWSIAHGHSITFFVVLGVIVTLICPLILVVLIPLAIACGIAFLAGFIRVWLYGRGTAPSQCAACGIVEPKNAVGWHMSNGQIQCQDCP